MQTVRSFVGMDVHKETISISVAEDGRNGEVRFTGVIPNQPEDIAKMAKRLAKHGELDFCYEAGGCGYNIYRQLTALATTDDLSRSESPRMLMGYLGLVPSEHSSGGSIRRGGITKTGNREARRMLIEAAWSYRYPARVAKEKAEILVRLPKSVRDIAWKAQTRLCARYCTMVARGRKPTVVVAALARELAGFIWPIGQQMRATAVIDIEGGSTATDLCSGTFADQGRLHYRRHQLSNHPL